MELAALEGDGQQTRSRFRISITLVKSADVPWSTSCWVDSALTVRLYGQVKSENTQHVDHCVQCRSFLTAKGSIKCGPVDPRVLRYPNNTGGLKHSGIDRAADPMQIIRCKGCVERLFHSLSDIHFRHSRAQEPLERSLPTCRFNFLDAVIQLFEQPARYKKTPSGISLGVLLESCQTIGIRSCAERGGACSQCPGPSAGTPLPAWQLPQPPGP